MKQVDKNILRLVYGISVITLHQYDFLADSEHRSKKAEREFGIGG